jgi:hypothetical protein
MKIAYDIVPAGAGWQVTSRGFVWLFADLDEATRFALDMAENYAFAAGRATSVRRPDGRGGLEELRSFAGITSLAGAIAATEEARRMQL